MTRLRQQTLEELERRNYSANTIRVYLRAVEDFARYFQRRPDRLGPEHIREYQAHLFRDRKLAANTVAQRLTGLRFFYFKTLRRSWDLSLTPYPKKPRRLPSILSPQEVARLIDAASSMFHRMILMTLYATGMRRAELTRLQIDDIDPNVGRSTFVAARAAKTATSCSASRCSSPYGSMFEGCGADRNSGCFRAEVGMPPIIRSAPAPSGMLAIKPPCGPASPSRFTPTLCGIASPRTCSKPGRIYAPSRCCWVIAT